MEELKYAVTSTFLKIFVKFNKIPNSIVVVFFQQLLQVHFNFTGQCFKVPNGLQLVGLDWLVFPAGKR